MQDGVHEGDDGVENPNVGADERNHELGDAQPTTLQQILRLSFMLSIRNGVWERTKKGRV